MPAHSINLRQATSADLDAINRVIEAAIMTWNLPERVKRLSLPSYRYSSLDFDHLQMTVAEDETANIVGVAAWEPADKQDTPAGCSALLLHGIYVQPSQHRQGIGHKLFAEALQAVTDQHVDGLLVKAQQEASGFFMAQGMQRLPVEDAARDYANRFWKPASG